MAGKERWHGLGSFKDDSLKDARLARDAARLRVKGDRSTPGVDIVQEKRTQAIDLAHPCAAFGSTYFPVWMNECVWRRLARQPHTPACRCEFRCVPS